MTTNDVSWTVDGIASDGLASTTPEVTRGMEITLPLVFYDTQFGRNPPDPTGFGYADDAGTVGTTYPALYPASTMAWRDRYTRLRAYLEFANGASTQYGTTHRGVPWFRERLPDRASVGSLVVPIEPDDDVIDAEGLWGLLVGGSDPSTPPTSTRQLDLSVFVLAGRDEYADRDAITTDLGADVI